MGWEDYHQYEFRINDSKYCIPIPDLDDAETENSTATRPNDLDLAAKQKFEYIYDFGDYWEHKIKIEKILPTENNTKYPKCLDGKRACLPEDCFGPPGYESLLELPQRPKDKLDEYDLGTAPVAR